MKYLLMIGMILLVQNRISSQDLTFTEIKNAVVDNDKYDIQSNTSRMALFYRPSFDWSNFHKILLERRFVFIEANKDLGSEIWAFNYNKEHRTASIWIYLNSDYYDKSNDTISAQIFHKGIEMTFSANDYNYNYLEDKIKQLCTFKKAAYRDIDNAYQRIYLHHDGLVFTLWTDIKNNTNHIYLSHSKESQVRK